MIEAVTAVLADLGLLPPGRRPGYNIAITTGAGVTFVLQAMVARDRFFHVKASESEDLSTVHRTQRQAWQALGKFVPEPLGYTRKLGWDVMVTEGIEFRRIPIDALASPKSPEFRGVIEFLQIQRVQARVSNPARSHRALLETMRCEFSRTPYARIVEPWVGAPEFDGLSHVMQHGDFARANLGDTDSGLVVFDWEEYGKTTLPGYDLCTLVASLVGSEPAELKLIRAADRSGMYTALVEAGCEAIGIAPALFGQLLPVYLLISVHEKRSYGTVTQARLKTLIDCLE